MKCRICGANGTPIAATTHGRADRDPDRLARDLRRGIGLLRADSPRDERGRGHAEPERDGVQQREHGFGEADGRNRRGAEARRPRKCRRRRTRTPSPSRASSGSRAGARRGRSRPSCSRVARRRGTRAARQGRVATGRSSTRRCFQRSRNRLPREAAQCIGVVRRRKDGAQRVGDQVRFAARVVLRGAVSLKSRLTTTPSVTPVSATYSVFSMP